MKLLLLGYIKKNDAIEALRDFVLNSPDYPNDIKIITCAIMGHGTNMTSEIEEGDW